MSATFLSAWALHHIAVKSYERTKLAPSDTTPGQDDALVAILFSAASLEAQLMELAHIATATEMSRATDSLRLQALSDILEELEEAKASVQAKYRVARRILLGTGYDKGAHPFQDFQILIRLRNAIVHLKPEHITPEPLEIVKALISRGLCESEDGARSSLVHQVGTRAVARWACNTAVDMIHSLFEPAGAEKAGSLRVFFESYEYVK
jgi:hypothetical protein